MRTVLAILFVLATAPSSGAQSDLVFAVNEGVTYRTTPHETRERHRALAEAIGIALKRYVRVEAVADYSALRRGLEARRYDLAYVHPAHHSLRAVRDQNYRVLAVTRGYTDYRAHFLAKADGSINKPEDVGGRNIVMPDGDSITAWMARATLRDIGLDPTKEALQTTRYQDGIPFMLEQGFFEVGVTASIGVVKAWQSKGGRVVFGSKPVPIKHFIASPRVGPDDLSKIRQVILGLETAEGGRALLDRIGIEGFEAPNLKLLVEAGRWLGI